MSTNDQDFRESELPASRSIQLEQPGVGLVALALILPVLAGVGLMFVSSFEIALGISAATVVLSSLLVALDSHQLGRVDKTGKERESAVLLFFGMCFLWIVVFPLAIYRRRQFDGPNLVVPAILVALFFVGGPFVVAMLRGPELPACDSKEVIQLVEQLVRGSPTGHRVQSITGHRQISYDSAADRRHGQCVIQLDGRAVPAKYLVQWRDRSKGQFEVRITE
jgi:hypothetical protein